MAVNPSSIRWDTRGLVVVAVQHARTGTVLMIGYANPESLERTIETGVVHFWSRSRNEIWQKGSTSGNTLTVDSIHLDCDSDALLIKATPAGPTCHTGQTSCFETEAHKVGIHDLWNVIATRANASVEESYTASLVAQGTDAVSRKIIEEAGEVVLAAKNHEAGGSPERVIEEAADLTYHLLVLLAQRGLTLESVERELDRRRTVDTEASNTATTPDSVA